MKIKRGQKIIVDKGILGKIEGKFVSTKGWSIGGFWGLYKTADGEKHIWDETVHKLKLV